MEVFDEGLGGSLEIDPPGKIDVGGGLPPLLVDITEELEEEMAVKKEPKRVKAEPARVVESNQTKLARL